MPDATRPLITFAVFAYNQEDVIAEAVEGAFAQTYSPLEIILSDDGSSDGTFEIMAKMAAEYDGPHTVRARRSPQNRGLLGHINDVASEVRGEIVVMAAGDDVSLPERTEVLASIFAQAPRAQAICSKWLPFGQEFDALKRLSVKRISRAEEFFSMGGVGLGATYGYRIGVFGDPGPLPEDLTSEDKILPARAAILGKTYITDAPLVCYRISETSLHATLKRERRLARQNHAHISMLIGLIKHGRANGHIGAIEAASLVSLVRLRRLIQTMTEHRSGRMSVFLRVGGRRALAAIRAVLARSRRTVA